MALRNASVPPRRQGVTKELRRDTVWSEALSPPRREEAPGDTGASSGGAGGTGPDGQPLILRQLALRQCSPPPPGPFVVEATSLPPRSRRPVDPHPPGPPPPRP